MSYIDDLKGYAQWVKFLLEELPAEKREIIMLHLAAVDKKIAELETVQAELDSAKWSVNL